MKKIKNCFIGLLTLTFLILLSINSFAAKGSFSVSKSSVTLTEGNKTTFNITATNCEGKFSISSSNTSVIKVSSSSVWITGSQSITLTAVKPGTAKITITATNVGDTSENEVTGSKTISVTVKAKSSSTNGDDKTTSATTTKPTFTSKNQTVYANSEVNVRSSYNTSSSKLGTLQKGDSVKRTGIATKSVNGILWSKVSYNGKTGYISSSFLTTTKPANTKTDEEKKDDTKKDEKSTNANLKSLSVTPTGLSPVFANTTTEYAMTVGSNIDEIDVKALAEDKSANVKVTGNTNLKIGTNTITIVVTAGDGRTTKTYRITVTKEEKKQLQLSELLVEGLPLEPEFDKNVYEYTLTLDRSDVSEINITATPTKESAEVEIVGNTDLKPGENVVTILVKSANGEDITTYQITVTIPELTAEVVVEDTNKDLYLYIGIGAGAFIILLIIVIVKKRHNKENDNMYYGMYNPNGNDEEVVPNKSEGLNDKKETSNIDLDELPKLDNEDLPKSLRKDVENKNISENAKTSNTELEKNIKTDRSKKIDEFYNTEDDVKPRRGKHSK